MGDMIGREVTFFENADNPSQHGTIFRGPWGRANNVSIHTDDARTFVRLLSDVTVTDQA